MHKMVFQFRAIQILASFRGSILISSDYPDPFHMKVHIITPSTTLFPSLKTLVRSTRGEKMQEEEL